MNFIDVSPYYGHYKAETVLGKALKEMPRDKYYLSIKVNLFKTIPYPQCRNNILFTYYIRNKLFDLILIYHLMINWVVVIKLKPLEFLRERFGEI